MKCVFNNLNLSCVITVSQNMKDQAQIQARKSQNAATASTAPSVMKTQRMRTRTCCIHSFKSFVLSCQLFKVMNVWSFIYFNFFLRHWKQLPLWIMLERNPFYQSPENNMTPVRRGSVTKVFLPGSWYFCIFLPSANEQYGLTPGSTAASKDMRFRSPGKKLSNTHR